MGLTMMCMLWRCRRTARFWSGDAFTTLAGQTRNYLGRLNADGSLDTSFTNGANNYVYSLAVQADGKILVGGLFTNVGRPGAELSGPA